MIETSSRFRSTLARAVLVVAPIAALASGCSEDGLGQRYKVVGKVTYKGEPVKEGSIQFYPSGGGGADQRGATGVITDGYYALSTQGDDDGAFPGDYGVTITARKPDMTKAKETGDKIGGLYPQEAVAKAYKKAESDVPKKYESPEAGGLKAKVEAKSNEINFDLVD